MKLREGWSLSKPVASEFANKNAMNITIGWYLDNGPWWRNIKSGEYQEYYARMYGGR